MTRDEVIERSTALHGKRVIVTVENEKTGHFVPQHGVIHTFHGGYLPLILDFAGKTVVTYIRPKNIRDIQEEV